MKSVVTSWELGLSFGSRELWSLEETNTQKKYVQAATGIRCSLASPSKTFARTFTVFSEHRNDTSRSAVRYRRSRKAPYRVDFYVNGANVGHEDVHERRTAVDLAYSWILKKSAATANQSEKEN